MVNAKIHRPLALAAISALGLSMPMSASAFVPIDTSVLSSHAVHEMHDALVQAQHVAAPFVHSPIAAKVHELVLQSAKNVHIPQAGSKLLASYGQLLHDHPLETKAATAATLATAGDAVAQKAQSSSSTAEYDRTRGISFALFSAMYSGIFQHYWFGWENHNLAFTASRMSPALAVLFASSSSVLPIAKLCLNQFAMVPAVYMPLFFFFTGSMAGLSIEESMNRAKSMYGPLLFRNWCFWLPAQFVQFAFVSPEWQVPYLCAAGLIWTIILSSASSGTAATTAESASIHHGEAIDNSSTALGVLEADAVTIEDISDTFSDATSDMAEALIKRVERAH